ncbi:MAG: hypothetical protein KME49_16455 [Brasilonema octagenarum HA4186-MV1]|jgi:predicted translin family RNA/ssDNA-binding protein|nr:hypothetical protein [Brasilonema octagenarum HA4186-MV1]
MAYRQNPQRRRDELQKLYDLLNEKIVRLRTARIIETDAAIIFRLDKQIEEAQTEHDKIAQQIDSLDKALEQGY